MAFNIIEHHEGRTDQVGEPLVSLKQAIQNARDLAEQELLNGWSAFYTVVDADGNEIYNSETDSDPRMQRVREQSLTRVMKPTE
jgi:hypothetical protein